MLKLRTFGNSSPTSTLTLTQEYDEIQAANIFPTVQEDQSVGTNNVMDQSIRSKGSKDSNPNSSNTEADLLKTQVENLRQQLAERDSTVNNLHQQIQEDKRAHDKLKERYDLFLGVSSSSNGGNTGTSTRRLNTSTHTASEDGSNMTTAEMLRLHKYMDQLEAEKEAAFQKTLSLSVALAESKARCSTLESQIDEYQSVIKVQNSSLGFGLFNLNSSSNNATPSTPAPAATPSKRVAPARRPSANSTNNVPGFKRKGSLTKATVPDPFLPIADIQLGNEALAEEEQHEINLNSDAEDDDTHTGKYVSGGFHDGDDLLSVDAESLGWSGRPLSYFSERSGGGSNRGSNRGTAARRRLGSSGSLNGHPGGNTQERQNRKNLLKGFRGMISNRNNNSSTSEEGDEY